MFKKLLFGVTVILFALLPLSCGHQTATTSVSQPGGVTLRGTVREYTANFEGGDPIPNAFVFIDGDSGVWNATTDSKGEYNFTGIPDGSYRVSVSAEGYCTLVWWQGQTAVKPVELRAAENTDVAVDIYALTFPIITAFTPVPGSVIANDQTFTITFDEAMDISSVRVQLIPQGIRSSAVGSGDTVQADITWSSDSKEVTVTPNGNLISNEVYRLQLVPPVTFSWPLTDSPYDLEGNPLYWGAVWWGGALFDRELTYFADYRTESGGVPGAPSNLQVVINGKLTSGVDFSDVFMGTNDVMLNWSPSSSGNITGYKVYVAKSGSVSNYTLLKAATGATSTEVNYFTSDVDAVITALYDGTVDPISTQNYPFVNDTVYFKVVAYNGDGESGGSVVSAKDVRGPQKSAGPVNFNKAGFAGATLANNYYLPPIGGSELDRVYVYLNEPIDPSSVAGNFSLDGGLNVVSATFLTNCFEGIALNWRAVVEIKADGDLSGRTLTVLTGVKDLAGNPVEAGTSDTFGPF